MDWNAVLSSPLAVWVPVIVLVFIVSLMFRKQLGGLMDRLTKGKVEASPKGVIVDLEAVPSASDRDSPPTTEPAKEDPAEPAQPPPAIRARQLRSRKGGALLEDETGRGVDAEDIETEDDILISTSDPKAKPPA